MPRVFSLIDLHRYTVVIRNVNYYNPREGGLKKSVSGSILIVWTFSPLVRDNLVFLQVGFKSLSYEMQEQQPAYDSNSLFGKKCIGNAMAAILIIAETSQLIFL